MLFGGDVPVEEWVIQLVVEATVDDLGSSLHISLNLFCLLENWHEDRLDELSQILFSLLALLLRSSSNWHLSNNLDWLSYISENLSWLSGDDLLLNSLLDKLLGFLEELKLGQRFLKELEAADLVNGGEDEEEHNWAHGIHRGP